MKLSARLILLLTVSVSAVMVVASLITLRQREEALLNAAHVEARAHALTLRIALEEDYRIGRSLDAQRLINRLRENTGVLSVVLFNVKGDIVAISKTLVPVDYQDSDEAREVMKSGKTLEIERRSQGKKHLSIITPLIVREECIGAIEIVLEISFVEADIMRARIHIAVTSLLLVLTILLVVTTVTRYGLTRPIRELLQGAAAVGRGDLNYRVPVKPAYGELASLAQEFNRMADRLEEQREQLLHESEEKVQLERKLRHNEQLALVGKLAAGVAHEVGAPLQVIGGRANNLLQNVDLPVETRQRYLTIISSQADKIARLVRQLLNLSQPYNLDVRDVSLKQLIQETMQVIEYMAETANVALEVREAADVTLEVDAELIQQLLLNICRNGIQAIADQGHLIIDWRDSAAQKNGKTFAAVRIQDTGGGIAQEHLPVLFDLFFTTKEVGEGTGLGLPVSRHIAEEHGGWIEAANRTDGGAVFTVYLPQASGTIGHGGAEDRGRPLS